MDFPVHVAAAVCAGQALIYAKHCMHVEHETNAEQDLLFATACVLVGTATHLILDAVPHYDFLYGVGRFGRHFPYVVRKALQAPKILLITLPVFLIFWKYTRQHWFLTLSALGGGLFPDIEKAAYLHSAYPRALVLFPWHSCSYSSAGWEVEYRDFLIVMEIIVYLGLLLACLWCGRRMRGARHIPGEFERSFLSVVRQAHRRMVVWFHREPFHE